MPHYHEDWRQGTILEYQQKEWLILTHCCDIRHGALQSEPSVELIQIQRCDQRPEKDKHKGRHPRLLHLEDGSNRIEVASNSERIFVPKQELLEDSRVVARLPAHSREYLRFWIGRKYTRAAFADCFNIRFTEIASKIKRKLKQLDTSQIHGLYFREVGAGELEIEKPEGEAYEVELWIVLIAGHDNETREVLESLAEELENLADSAEIDLDVRVLNADGVSLSDHSQAIRWSEHDWMSN